ncbi:MAG: prephenate dehydrogenase/arogenate dehydrogenase family protein [Ktedonobacteraceae bacterium]
MFDRIAIIGLGLIGGSIGLALRRATAAREIIGYDMREGVSRQACTIGAIDRSCDSLADTVQEAELVVLATPVGAMRMLLESIGPLVSPGTVITDVASTKAQVIAWAEEFLPSSVPFVGGHPMTGKEVSGVEVADEFLFQDCVYCLTPTPSTQRAALHKVATFVEILHAHISYLEPEEHDTLVAAVSHLPFIASIALMTTVAEDATWNEASLLAAGGFRDMSRLAGGNPEMYHDICMTNNKAIEHWLDAYIDALKKIRSSIQHQDKDLRDTFAEAQHLRLQWLASKNFQRHQNTGIS